MKSIGVLLVLATVGPTLAHGQGLQQAPLKPQTLRTAQPVLVPAPLAPTVMALRVSTPEERIARLEREVNELRTQLADLRQRYENHAHQLNLGFVSPGNFVTRTEVRGMIVYTPHSGIA